MPNITLLPDNRILAAELGENLHAVLAREGLIDAPCGGQGICGKCRVLAEGREVLACRTPVRGDMAVSLPERESRRAKAVAGKRVAFDIGTTTLVCYVLDGQGKVLAQNAMGNPQCSFGADVISRIRAARSGQRALLTQQIRRAMAQLLVSICADPEEIEIVSVVGNPTMQQLFLGLSVDNLAQIPYAPVLLKARQQDMLLTVPDISGFVGADTVAAVLSCGILETEELTLLVDIGTNGELVLGNKDRMLACATAAGPALEGANISQGMRAEKGAIDHVWLEKGRIRCSVIGGGPAKGICGSGLVDAVACALELGLINRRGRICGDVMLTDGVFLTQEDIRQVQLAKGAIAAGIRLLTERLGQPQRVLLAGAFGSCLNPKNACRIGLLPPELEAKITAVGNAAGRGAVLLAADPGKLSLCNLIVEKAEYMDLSTQAAFPRTFAKAMEFREDWCASALALGFTAAAPLEPAALQAREDVRAMCAEDKCHAYGKNWCCPPHCGSIEACQEKMHGYTRGVLLQTVGQMAKAIDAKAYRETEQRHLENFANLCAAIRRQYPDALCLGAGGCRVCKQCAWPQACRFPEQAVSSMEAYGLFVTQVCRNVGLPYYYGEKTITYTACILY